VCISDLDEKALAGAEVDFRTLGAPFLATQLDVTSREQVDAWIDEIVETYGRLDGAANCAGIVGRLHGITTVAELEDEEWNRIIGVNLTGLMYCLRAELRKIADFGSIVNISSVCLHFFRYRGERDEISLCHNS